MIQGREMAIADVAKMEAANAVLQTFAPGTTIERRKGGWFVLWSDRWGNYEKRWQTRGNDFYPVWHREWGHGGTACTALAQLIRWLRGQGVLSIVTWRMWAGEGYRLLRHGDVDAALQGLLDAGYPEVTTCVLCGRSPLKSIDWWNLDGVSGPCCSGRTGCRQREKIK